MLKFWNKFKYLPLGLQNFIITITCLIILLFISEASLRYLKIYSTTSERIGHKYQSFYNPGYNNWYHVYEPNYNGNIRTIEFISTINTNGLGFNDREWTVEKEKYRVILIGDSFTEGMGASTDSTICKLLEKNIDSIEFQNWGIRGSDPFYYYNILKDIALNYYPDKIIIFINYTDINDIIRRGGIERFKEGGITKYKPPPWWEIIYARIHLFRGIIHSFLKYNYNFMKHKEFIIAEKNAINLIENCIDSIADLCRNNNIDIVFVFHPLIREIENDAYLVFSELIEKIRTRVEVFDMMEYFIYQGVTKDNAMDYYWPIDK